MTQRQMVLKHLKTHVGLTQRQASEKYGIDRLPARVFELRAQGYKILSIDHMVPTKYEKPSRITEYRLVKE